MGLVVKQIIDHSSCALLHEGDIIMEVNGKPVHNYKLSDLELEMGKWPKGQHITIGIIRPMAKVCALIGYVHSCSHLKLRMSIRIGHC